MIKVICITKVTKYSRTRKMFDVFHNIYYKISVFKKIMVEV